MKYIFTNPIHGSIGTQKYQCTIEWRNGKFIADEPVTSGGGDTGPDPHTILLSSLAACTLATLRMYIDRKGWDIPEIAVNVNMYQMPKEDKIVSIIDRDIKLPPSITDEQRNRLVEIAQSCPISRVLQGEVVVRTYAYNESDTEKKIKYTNGEVTVVWKPEFCKHSGRCVTQLPQVFNLNTKPWVNVDGASSEAILQQVQSCPTGALSGYKNEL